MNKKQISRVLRSQYSSNILFLALVSAIIGIVFSFIAAFYVDHYSYIFTKLPDIWLIYSQLMSFASWITVLGSWKTNLALLIVFFIAIMIVNNFNLEKSFRRQQAKFISFMIASLLATSLVVHIIKINVNRPRPYVQYLPEIQLNPVQIAQDISTYYHSFPSGHAATAGSIATGLALILIASKYKYNIIALIMIYILYLHVGISRVVLGVHYPSDIIAGFTIGITTSLLVAFVIDIIFINPIMNNNR